MKELEKKLWNIHLLVDEIKLVPQTYKTILKEHNTGTYQMILRRKLNNLCKDGTLCKIAIPGRRREAIIYHIPKKYNILVEGNRTGCSNVYYFFDFKKVSRYYVKLNEYWKLEKFGWVQYNDEKVFFQGNVLKWL